MKKNKKRKWVKKDYFLFTTALLGLIYLLIFAYGPMVGVILAFKDGNNKLNVLKAMFETKWVWFDNFKEFLQDQKFLDVLLNTLGLNLIMLFINFPAPIIFALLINEVRNKKYKKVVQSASIFPHFLSWVIFGGIIIALTDMTTGVINPLLYQLGIGSKNNPINLQTADYFWGVIIISSLIKGTGWGSIIYLASIAGIDPTLYEAATMDGANRFQKARYITLPLISGTITVYLLLTISNLLANSFEQFYVLQNAANLSRSEVLATFIYKNGIIWRKYSFTAAIGLFEATVGIILLTISNKISKKVSGKGLFGNAKQK